MPGKFGYSQLERNGENERGGNVVGNVFGLLEVDSIKLVLGSQIKNSLDKRGAVPRSDRRGEIAGTSPSTDGDASHRTMSMSLLDKVRDVLGAGGIQAEDGGIWGGDAKNTCMSA